MFPKCILCGKRASKQFSARSPGRASATASWASGHSLLTLPSPPRVLTPVLSNPGPGCRHCQLRGRQVRAPSSRAWSPGPGNTGVREEGGGWKHKHTRGRAAAVEQRPRVLDDRQEPRLLRGMVWLRHGPGSRGGVDQRRERMTVTSQELMPPLCTQE